MDVLHLDYETYSEEDLRQCGAYKYARHPSTEALMLGWAYGDDPVQLWQPRLGPMPPELRKGIESPDVLKKAFNANFERNITRHVLGIDAPPESWRCVMVDAFYLSFTGGLGTVLNSIGLPAKDKEGDKLINLFAKPAPRNHHATRYDWTNRPEQWEAFCGYCKTDVEVERELDKWMSQFPQMPQWDREQWYADQHINDTGVLLDTNMATAAIELWKGETESLKARIMASTGLDRPTRGPFLEYLQSKVEVPDTRKDTLLAVQKDCDDHTAHVIDLWLQKEAKAVSKFSKINKVACADSRARGMFQYKGAARTDRVGGRLIQLQNLKRPFVHSPEEIPPLVGALKRGSPRLLEALYGMPVSEILGGSIRHAVTAKEGHTLVVSDLSSIESVVIGWLTGCGLINKTFAEGKDSYKVFASQYYNIPYEQVTKAQRSFSKPPVLGCFAEDTLVLTPRGWVPIVKIAPGESVWDGVNWVVCDGVVNQGRKETVSRAGVFATPDHKVLSGEEWIEWKDLTGENLRKAILSESGQFSCMSEVCQDTLVDVSAELSGTCIPGVSQEESLSPALLALTNEWLGKDLLRPNSALPREITTGLLTGSTPRELGVLMPQTPTTGAEGLLWILRKLGSTSGISSLYRVGKTRGTRSIERITRRVISEAISGSLTGEPTPTTLELTEKLTIWVKRILRSNSGGKSVPDIETKAQWRESTGMAKRAARSYETTYDILNAGPRNRFTILTEDGPVAVHNCGFMLGWRGMIAYAEGYGIDMEEGDARRAVDTFRGMYPEIPKFWYWIDDAVKYVTETGNAVEGYRLTISRDKEFLRILLPSGRHLSYYKPEVRALPAPWDAEKLIDNFTFMGMNTANKWTRLSAHAGLMTENVVQSIAGDILWNGIMHARSEGLNVVLHVHDEIGCEEEEGQATEKLKLLINCMTRKCEWNQDMWLGADGFITKNYTKD